MHRVQDAGHSAAHTMAAHDHAEDARIVGSAEPLSAEARIIRLRELAAWGVDLTLIEANLRRTPTERVAHMLALRDLGRALRQAYLDREAARRHDHSTQAVQSGPHDEEEGSHERAL